MIGVWFRGVPAGPNSVTQAIQSPNGIVTSTVPYLIAWVFIFYVKVHNQGEILCKVTLNTTVGLIKLLRKMLYVQLQFARNKYQKASEALSLLCFMTFCLWSSPGSNFVLLTRQIICSKES